MAQAFPIHVLVTYLPLLPPDASSLLLDGQCAVSFFSRSVQVLRCNFSLVRSLFHIFLHYLGVDLNYFLDLLLFCKIYLIDTGQ